MKIWKLVAGILSIAMSLFVLFQSFFAGLFNIATSNGQSSGTAGVIVAVMLLTGGIVSIVTRKGSVAGGIALCVIYGIGAAVGFIMAGDYKDLTIWAGWCMINVFLALIDIAIHWGRDREDDFYPPEKFRRAPAPKAVPLRSVITETNPQLRDAMIDRLPEYEAKSYLKQILSALISKKPLGEDEDDGILMPILVAVLAIIGVGLLLLFLYIGANAFFGGQTAEVPQTPPAQTEPASQSPAPSAEPSPSDEPSPVPESEPPAETEPSTSPEASPSNELENETFGVGDAVNLNDVIVTLVSVSESTGSEFITPAEGNTFVLCEFEISNDSGQDITVSSLMSFETYVDSYSTGISIGAQTSSGRTALDGSVAAGRRMNGVIGYEVSQDWSSIEIRFTPDFWSGSTAIFVYDKET